MFDLAAILHESAHAAPGKPVVPGDAGLAAGPAR